MWIFDSYSFPWYLEISYMWHILFPSIDGLWRSPVMACTCSSWLSIQTLMPCCWQILCSPNSIIQTLACLGWLGCRVPKQTISQIFHLRSIMKNCNEVENFDVVWIFFYFLISCFRRILCTQMLWNSISLLTLKNCNCSLREMQVYADIPNLLWGRRSFISILFPFVLCTHTRTKTTTTTKPQEYIMSQTVFSVYCHQVNNSNGARRKWSVM